ncbi:MAG: diphthine--ammonia ligase [Candidatus Micrarchaeota archaeon]|nr:diphthine--ammonia ligase [Candidatus Micrarchaeota archaeon]MDE1859317.1 diphthine--ammonia ligase [Candidatus Micrarchaeota archaeon]
MVNACLYSGGKDSTLSLHKAIALGIPIDLIITMISKSKESYMFHYPNVKYTCLQAEALGIKQVFAHTEGKKEEELKDLERVLKENNVKFLVTGATYSRYQGERINKLAASMGIEHLAPLWHIDPEAELGEIATDFNAIITSVSAEGFDESFLGHRIDEEIIKKLRLLHRKYGINMLFEGGEAESFVLDAPLFKKKIVIKKARTEWNGNRGMYIIEDAVFQDKK